MQESISRPLAIFVVDDSEFVRRTLADLLALLPHVEVCGEARSVAEALPGLAARRPDVVILDFNLPEGSGPDLLQAIHVGIPDAIVMIHTAHPYHDLGDRCREGGTDFYFEKGSDLDTMFAVLTELGKPPQPSSLARKSKVPEESKIIAYSDRPMSDLARQKARTNQVLESGYEGTGIGPAIVRHAVVRMGGTVAVDSKPGRRGVFTVELAAVHAT